MDQSQQQHTDPGFTAALNQVVDTIVDRFYRLESLHTIPEQQAIQSAIASLPSSLPADGLGTQGTIQFLTDQVLPGLLQGQPGPRYFGFVTGGVTPAAQLADMLVSSYDENVQVALPQYTASTAIESRTLDLVLDLLGITPSSFNGKTTTTGATASNVLGLACARDALCAKLFSGHSFASEGFPIGAPSPPIVILALHPHYSILKAASLVGLGSGPRTIQLMPAKEDDELSFDLDQLSQRLQSEAQANRGVIVCCGFGEVNTGGLCDDLDKIAGLCKQFGAWLHVDAAFGGFATLLPEYRHLTQHLALCDSLTLDGHKWLNTPYDCGLFFTKLPNALPDVFNPPGSSTPAYLSSNTLVGDAPPVPSPLYVGIENSRRFRALPLLSSLLSLGKSGYEDIISRNVALSREIAKAIDRSDNYILVNRTQVQGAPIVPLNVVLFRASPKSALSDAEKLTAAINDSKRMYVTSTKWRGQGAVRLAVSNWRSGQDVERETSTIQEILEGIIDTAE